MVKIITNGCDSFFNYAGFGAHDNVCAFQGFLCMVNVLLSFWPLLCYLLYSTDVHIVFWLGPVPQYVNLAVPCCLCFLNLGVNFFGIANKSRGATTRVSCFFLFVILGSLLLAGGAYVTMIAEKKAAELTSHCGETPLTRKLETQWLQLNRFYESCDPKRQIAVTQCPGMTRQFPNMAFINYLEQLEYEFDCVGFCQFWSKPIFNQDAELGKRCASALGTHVGAVAGFVGMPTAGLGLAMISIGICLSGYEHL